MINFISKNKALSLTVLNVFLALGVFFQKDPFQFFTKNYETSPRFYSAKLEELQSFSLEREGVSESKVQATKDSGNWKIEIKGKSFEGSDENIAKFLENILEARKFTIITEDESKQTELGVKGSEAFILEISKKDKPLGKMHIGSLASGGFTYVRWNDGKEIYLVEENLKNPMGRGAIDFFVNKKMSTKTFTPEEVASIQLNDLENPKKSYHLLKKGSEWEAQAPEVTPVSRDEVNGLTRSLSGLTADEIVFEEPKDLTEVGKYEIVYGFQSTDKGGESVAISILGKDKTDNYYGRRNNSSALYKFSSYALKTVLEFDVMKAKK